MGVSYASDDITSTPGTIWYHTCTLYFGLYCHSFSYLLLNYQSTIGPAAEVGATVACCYNYFMKKLNKIVSAMDLNLFIVAGWVVVYNNSNF